MGPLRGNQGIKPYPSGPSQPSTFKSLGHLGIMGVLTPPAIIVLFVTQGTAKLFFPRLYCIAIKQNTSYSMINPVQEYAVFEKINVLSFFLTKALSFETKSELAWPVVHLGEMTFPMMQSAKPQRTVSAGVRLKA